MTGRIHTVALAIALASSTASADVLIADIMPPMPPDRGTVAADLPAPRSPSRAQWPLVVAGVSLVLLAGGIVVRRRR
jgi:hypothetical protein